MSRAIPPGHTGTQWNLVPQDIYKRDRWDLMKYSREKQDAINKRQRDQRRLNGNRFTKKYEKTRNGFLMRLYRNMQSRVTGVQKQKTHLYLGKELLSREDFYAWAKHHQVFHVLFTKWEDSNYDRKLCPTVDRIDSSKGYAINNIEWVTHSENSSRGAISQQRNKKLCDIQ